MDLRRSEFARPLELKWPCTVVMSGVGYKGVTKLCGAGAGRLLVVVMVVVI